MRILSYILLLLVILFGITFACLNAEAVTINYYFNTKLIPLSLLLTITLFLGVVTGFICSISIYFRLKGENLRLLRQIKLLEKQQLNTATAPIHSQ